MAQLSETQSILLVAACQRPDRCALPLPPGLRGGAARKVVGALLARGLFAETEAAPGMPLWRGTADGHSVTLIATEAALKALGLESDTSPAGDSTARRRRASPHDAALNPNLGPPGAGKSGLRHGGGPASPPHEGRRPESELAVFLVSAGITLCTVAVVADRRSWQSLP
jgi:hypothetical protein